MQVFGSARSRIQGSPNGGLKARVADLLRCDNPLSFSISFVCLWALLTFFFVGTAHLPLIGESLDPLPLSEGLGLATGLSDVSSWHYPNACDAALQRARPTIQRYLVDDIGGCNEANYTMIVSVGPPIDGTHCAFILQTMNGLRFGFLESKKFSFEQSELVQAVRRRRAMSDPARELHIFMLRTEDVMPRDDCIFHRSHRLSDMITFLAYNPQALSAGDDPLLLHMPSAGRALSHTHVPRVMAIPHYFGGLYLGWTYSRIQRFFWGPDLVHPSASDLPGGIARVRPLRGFVNAEGRSMRQVVWRGVTTGRPFQVSDRYRAVIALQKEHLRRGLESPAAKAYLERHWASGESVIPAGALQRILDSSFADACFSKMVQGVAGRALDIVVRPLSSLATSPLSADDPSRVFGSYFVLEGANDGDEEGPRGIVNLNGKGACGHVPQSALIQRGVIHLDVDGNGNAWEGLRWKLCAGAVVVKVTSFENYYQWYYDKLVNGTHLLIVPSESLETDLVSTIDALAADEALMDRLSRGALAFCEAHLGPDAKEQFMEAALDGIPLAD